MEFTYAAYRDMIRLLKEKGYRFCNYHHYATDERCVILRHDIDNSLDKALRLAEVEWEEGVKSTYYVLLKTDFYNPAAKKANEKIRRIAALGHDIGLHFDESVYQGQPEDSLPELIRKETKILSEICDVPVQSFSMHRPNRMTIEKNLEVPGIIHAHGPGLFRGFKYLSARRRHWREPVLDIIREGAYDRLHILTHAFWYGEQEESIRQILHRFITSANGERYDQMAENIRSIEEILMKEEV